MWTRAVSVAVVLGVCPALWGQATISAEAYRDKLMGMWLGELMGNYAGRPREGAAPVRGGLTYAVNWTDANHVDASYGKDYVFRDAVWDGDDDTCFEYLYCHVLKDCPDPSASQIGQTWLERLAYPSFYIANRQAQWRIHQGDVPPASGSMQRNAHWYAIDSQITTECLGALAPAMPQRAADLAGLFGSVTNDGFALHAAQFYAAMYSAAAVESNVETLVSLGQQAVPTTSRTWGIIQDVRDWYASDQADGNLDWRSTQALIHDRYYAQSSGRYYAWYESSINTAMTTLAILYGQGDFVQTVEIGVQAGFDADCNPATAGGLVGLICGYSGLPADLRSRASEAYLASGSLTGIRRDANLAMIADDLLAAAELQVLQMGGTVTGADSNRLWQIPAAPLAPPAEKPDPSGPRGLAGQVRALGGAVTPAASIAQQDANDDRRNLAGIADGIADVSYNGGRAYSTYDGYNSQPAGGDWYQLTFDRTVEFRAAVFYEGDIVLGRPNSFPDANDYPPLGGWFTSLTVEVLRDGNFVPVSGLAMSEPLDPHKFYQAISMTFDPIEGNAIRIRGSAGGVAEYTTCLELEAYGSVPGRGATQWNSPSGDWGDSSLWTAAEPDGGVAATVNNGGSVTICQPFAACAELTVGGGAGSGSVVLAGGRLEANRVTVGMDGSGSFTQTGGTHVVREDLLIGLDVGGAGTYELRDGDLLVGGSVKVGGSAAAKGGTGSFTIDGGYAAVEGELVIWSGSEAHLGAGTLASLDGERPYVDVLNDGALYIESGVYCLGTVGSTGDSLAGSTVVKGGATLWAESIRQGSLIVEAGGAVHFAAEDYERFLSLARENLNLVPEPGALLLMCLGAVALAGRRGGWTRGRGGRGGRAGRGTGPQAAWAGVAASVAAGGYADMATRAASAHRRDSLWARATSCSGTPSARAPREKACQSPCS